jgi:hypothetical protein
MRRTQLYLDDELWKALHLRARHSGQTVSGLVRQALRERYLGAGSRLEAMQALVGIWKDRQDLPDTDAYVREVRKGHRLKRLTH